MLRLPLQPSSREGLSYLQQESAFTPAAVNRIISANGEGKKSLKHSTGAFTVHFKLPFQPFYYV